VVTIIKLLREEMDSHTATENTKFSEFVKSSPGLGRNIYAFHLMSTSRHLDQLSKDLESIQELVVVEIQELPEIPQHPRGNRSVHPSSC
jgi:hypothetical protein